MNRIFKSIWNAKTRTFVAVSELAAARGKRATAGQTTASSTARGSWTLRPLCALLLGAGMLSGGVAAAQQIQIGAEPPVAGDSIVFSGPGSIVFQNGGTLTGLTAGALAAGSTDAATGGQLFQVNTALGNRIDGLGTDLTSLGTDLSAIDGRVTTVESGVSSLTTRVTTTEGNVSTMTSRVDALETQLYADGDGVKYFRVNATGADASATGTNAVAIGAQAAASSANAVAIGNQANVRSSATSGIALGQNAVAGTASGGGVAAIAVGRNAIAGGTRALAAGDGATVASHLVNDAMAMGTGASVTGTASHRATAIGAGATASEQNATAVGAGAQAAGSHAIALGAASAAASNALAAGHGATAATPNSISLGLDAGAGTVGNAAGDRTSHVAIGTRAGQNVIGNQTTAIGFESGSNIDGDWNVAVGTQAGNGLTGDENVALGYRANHLVGGGPAASIQHATALGSQASARTDAVAVGYRANAASNGSVAIGTDSQVETGLGVAIGREARASGDNVALGANAVALPSDAAGTGYLTGSTFTNGNVVSVGRSGLGGQTRRIVNVADGAEAHDAVNVNQLQASQRATANLVGVSLNTDGSYDKLRFTDTNNVDHEFDSVSEAFATLGSGTVSLLPPEAVRRNADGQINGIAAGTLGTDAVNVEQMNAAVEARGVRYMSVQSSGLANEDNTGATGGNAIAIGAEAGAVGANAVAMGFESRAQAISAIALGHDTQALGVNSSVLGSNSTAYGRAGVAIGHDAISRGENSLVMGTGAQADPKDPNQTVDNAIVVGTMAEVTADDGIAVGRSALASELRGIAQGTNAHSQGVDATAIGTDSLADGVNAYASGTRARANGNSALASGTDARGYATNAIALGNDAISGRNNPDASQAPDNINTIAIGSSSRADARNATAIGRQAAATGTTALAIGDNTRVSGAASTAIGTNSVVTSANAGVLGNNNQLAASNAFIIGNEGNVTVSGGVALGSSSQATTGANRAGYVPNRGNAENIQRVDATTSTTGAIAVGSSTVRRQITGLAAGTADSDAVNVAQLKGTGWNIQTDGDTADHVSTGLGHTVDIGLADGESNLTVSRTTTPAGQTTIDYALAKNLDLGATGSVQTGNTLVNNAGVVVNDGTQVRTTLGAGNIQVTNGTNTVSVNSGTGTVNGLTNRTFDAASIVNGQAATEDQLRQVNNALIAEGFALQGADGNTVQRPLGEAIAVVGADTNITTRVQNGELQIGLGENVAVTNNLTVGGNTTLQGPLVVAGASTLSGGATIGNALTLNPNTQVDMGGNRITNVAAGTAATDAVNVSQLNDVAARPLTFRGNTGTVDRALGQTLAIEGGLATAATASSANLRTRVDAATGTVVLEMANDLTADSLTINNGGPVLNGDGLAMAGQQITGLADGTADDHAVNLSQLRDVQQSATAGWDLGVNGEAATNVAPGGAVDLGNTDGNIVLTQNGTDVTFDLADDVGITGKLSVGGTTTLQGPLNVTGVSTLGGGTVIGTSLTVQPNTTVDMGGNRITGVAAGTALTDAVNVSQLQGVAQTPITFAGNQGSVDRQLGETQTIRGGLDNTATASSSNLRTRVGTDGEMVIEMANDLTADSLTINNGGPRIDATGIDAANTRITGVAPGQDGTDAVNVDQLDAVDAIARTGWDLGVNGETAENVAPGDTVNLDNTDGNIVLTQDGTDVTFDLADDVAIANDLSVGGNTTLQGNLAVTGMASLTGGAVIGASLTVQPGTTIDMGGNRITRVAPGTAGTDAVNLDQLNELDTALSNRPITFTGNTGSVERRLGETLAVRGGLADGAPASSANLRTRVDAATGVMTLEMANHLTADSLAINNGGPVVNIDGIAMNDRQITGLAAGTQADHAVNLGQLRTVQDTAEMGWNISANGGAPANVGPGATVDLSSGDGNIGIAQSGTQLTLRLSDSIHVNNNLTVGGDVAIGGHTMLSGGMTVANQFVVAGGTVVNMGGNRVTNVAPGVDANDAVNVSQLQAVSNGVDRLRDRAVVYDGEVGDPKDRVTLEGERSTDGGRTGGTTITNLARGEISATSTDAINGSQIHEIGTDIANGLGGDSRFVDGRLITELNVGGNTYTSVNAALDGVQGNIDDVSAVASRGWDLQVNGEEATQVAPGSTVQFVEGENVTIVRDGLAVTVDVARDLKVDSVTADEVAIENGPTINREGIDMANQRIRNVAEGVGPTDAVNVDQLNRVSEGMNQQVNRLDARINLAERRADAGVAAAMAAATLPQAYLPGKSMFAIGGGTWNGESGFALGLSTVSDNGKWVVKGTGAGSSRGDYGGAVGVGYQW